MEEDKRQFKKLRISLTDTCNLACTYCVPENLGLETHYKPDKQLSTKEYLAIIKGLHKACNLSKVRLTGGEPLLYLDIENLIKGIRQIGIEQVGITSNGTFLKKLASNLKTAGLNSINVSLDAIDKEIFFKLTRKPELQKTLDGIDAALRENLELKLNAVILKDLNEKQIIPLIEYGIQKGVPVRFLELMKMGYLHHNFNQYFVSQRQILNIIKEKYKIEPVHREEGSTANYWTIMGLNYQFGIIANETVPFCSDCDRLRLDSYGNIFGCISASDGIPILEKIKQNKEIKTILQKAKEQKQHHFIGSELSMRYLGG